MCCKKLCVASFAIMLLLAGASARQLGGHRHAHGHCQGIIATITSYSTVIPTSHVYGTIVLTNPTHVPVSVRAVLAEVTDDKSPAGLIKVAGDCNGDAIPPAVRGTPGFLQCTYRTESAPEHATTAHAVIFLQKGAGTSSCTTNSIAVLTAPTTEGTVTKAVHPSLQLPAAKGAFVTSRKVLLVQEDEQQAGAAKGRTLSQSSGNLQFVPQGCQGLTVTTAVHQTQDPNIISGTVLLQNPNTFSIPIAQVKVTLANNIPVAPITTLANCPTSEVPWNPQPYQLGQVVCNFAFALPTYGATSNPSVWTSAESTVTVAESNAACSSAVATVSPPLVYGH